ncbi:hypothetical protein RCL1_002829 [Eukaryota sp. TZLM3-RCL]
MQESSSKALEIVAHLRSLVERFVPSSKVESILPLSVQLLSSQLPLSVASTELALEELLVRKLKRANRTADIPRLQALIRRLSSCRVFSQRYSIIYLLTSLSNVAATPSYFSSSSLLQTSLPQPPSEPRSSSPPPLPKPSLPTASLPSKSLPEPVLVRCSIFAMQGIAVDPIIMSDGNLIPDPNLPPDIYSGLLRPCHVGNLLFVLESIISRKFQGRVTTGLQSYIRSLVATHRAEISELVAKSQENSSDLTLLRVFLWSKSADQTLSAACITGNLLNSYKGSKLVSELYRLSRHGDVILSKITRNALRQSLVPFLHLLAGWLADGELEEIKITDENSQITSYSELWIKKVPGVPLNKLWTFGFSLDSTVIPSFLPREYAELALMAGKSVAFARTCCDDSQFSVHNTSKISSNEVISELLDGEYKSLCSFIKKAADVSNSRLISLVFHKYSLKLHLNAIKRYLLLFQGDFVQSLLESLSQTLVLPAEEIHKHNLLSHLDLAIRSSNAVFDCEEVLNCLDIRPMTTSSGNLGWEAFTLDYRIDSKNPLTTVLSPKNLEIYIENFRFLWKLKRTELSLNNSWSLSVSKYNQSFPSRKVKVVSHHFHLFRMEMGHFVASLQHHVFLEVLEKSWQSFLIDLDKAVSLDDVIVAHDKLTETLQRKNFLDDSPASTEVLKILNRIFDLIFRFEQIHSKFSSSFGILLSKFADNKATLDLRRAQNQFDYVEDTERIAIENETLLVQMNKLGDLTFSELSKTSRDFRSLIRLMIETLQTIKDSSLKFFIFNLDFNSFYNPEAEKSLTFEELSSPAVSCK